MDRRHALYPGTFDPPTLGHLDVLERALALFDRVTVAVSPAGKDDFLPHARRLDLLRTMTAGWPQCRVVTLQGLTVDEMRRQGAGVVVRGIRGAGDFDYEWRLAGMNNLLFPESEAIFLMARPAVTAISGALVREVARHGGDVRPFVTAEVAAAIAEQDGRRH